MGLSPFLNASRILRVESSVRSSYSRVSTHSRPKLKDGTYVKVVANDEHWCVAARALALDLDDGELAVLGRLARLDATQMSADGVQDVVRTTKHAGGGGADLDKVLSDRFAVYAAQGTVRGRGRGRIGTYRLNMV